jgi:general secretion pathway protein N
MRADRIAPVTWLLATAAAWAVLGAALAWAGMGGRIAAADAASVAAQALPQPVADANAAAPAPFDAFASRPPFAQDRSPHPFVIPGGGNDARADASAFDYVLTSVLITPRLRMAIVEPAQGGESVRVRDGESAEGLGGWRLVELRPRAAVFEGPGGRRELDLRVWAGGDGTGAAAPGTMPMQAPPPAPMPATRAEPAPPAAPAAPEASQVAQQMNAIRSRIEARRAQLRREAQRPQPQSPAAATPQNTQSPGTPARNP